MGFQLPCVYTKIIRPLTDRERFNSSPCERFTHTLSLLAVNLFNKALKLTLHMCRGRTLRQSLLSQQHFSQYPFHEICCISWSRVAFYFLRAARGIISARLHLPVTFSRPLFIGICIISLLISLSVTCGSFCRTNWRWLLYLYEETAQTVGVVHYKLYTHKMQNALSRQQWDDAIIILFPVAARRYVPRCIHYLCSRPWSFSSALREHTLTEHRERFFTTPSVH